MLNFDHAVTGEPGQGMGGGRPSIWIGEQLKVQALFTRIFRDVWGNGEKLRLPFSANIHMKYRSVFERACAPRLLRRLLDGDVPERVCAACGRKFGYVTAKV